MKSLLSEWSFLRPNTLLKLPIDNISENYIRRNVPNVIFSNVTPSKFVGEPKLVCVSESALKLLDMDIKITQDSNFVNFIAGNYILPSCTPLAHRYGGHQFGVWAQQLGDGRAILLGEYLNQDNERWELQLKGAGLTPYSRDGDGRAVLRSSVREFLCAESMHHLGVPTSRVAALVSTTERKIMRDPLYTGNNILEPAAVVLRIAPSWFRIGSLEILAAHGEMETMSKLLHHIFETKLFNYNNNITFAENIINMGIEIIKRIYKTWIEWQRVGFIHGVLNTDNFSITGITIDYGPFAFMSQYNPRYVSNTSDWGARYCYEKQIDAVYFALEKLRHCLEIYINYEVKNDRNKREELLQLLTKQLHIERENAEINLIKMFSNKLGLLNHNLSITSLFLYLIENTSADFTATFRQLSEVSVADLSNNEIINSKWALKHLSKENNELWKEFIKKYKEELISTNVNEEERKNKMLKMNPCYVLRNWMAEDAIKLAENGDYSRVNLIEKILQNPYKYQKDADEYGYSGKPPNWECNLKVSCSS